VFLGVCGGGRNRPLGAKKSQILTALLRRVCEVKGESYKVGRTNWGRIPAEKVKFGVRIVTNSLSGCSPRRQFGGRIPGWKR